MTSATAASGYSNVLVTKAGRFTAYVYVKAGDTRKQVHFPITLMPPRGLWHLRGTTSTRGRAPGSSARSARSGASSRIIVLLAF